MKKTYAAKFDSLDELFADVDAFCAENRVDAASAYALNLCLDEIFTNIVSYGYKNDGSQKIEVELAARNGFAEAAVRDTAPAFDPISDAPAPDTSSDAESRDVGRLGIFFLKKSMDAVSYSRKNGVNELVMKRRLAAQ